MRARDLVHRLLAGRENVAAGCGVAFAPANIALVKYWGKRDAELNLPRTSSLSISLGEFGTHTRVELINGPDETIVNQEPVAADSLFARRLRDFLDLMRPAGAGFRVDTRNTVPTAAGLASSASGFAALVKALALLFRWELTVPELSILARLGSGSACRSLADGFVLWRAGEQSDGLDSWGALLAPPWPELRIGVVPVDTGTKAVSSRDGMNRTTATSEFQSVWPTRVERDLELLQEAINHHDFDGLGTVAEANAMAMHGLMLTARPPLVYWQPETVAVLRQIAAMRADGVPVYVTIDAGPNPKLIFCEAAETVIRSAFPELRVAIPAKVGKYA